MLIEIRNWDKYNPRNDAKAWSWFRFQNKFFDDPVIYDLSPSQKLLLVYLYAARNEAAKLMFRINQKQAADKLGSRPATVSSDLRALVSASLILLHDTEPVRERTDDERGRTDPYVDVRERTDDERGRTDPYVDVRERTDDEAIRTLRDVTLRDETGRDETKGYAEHPADASPLPTPLEPPKALPKKLRAPPGPSTPAGQVWEAYRAAYAAKYGHEPVRNARVNSQCGHLVQRVGAEAAVKLVAFYLTHSKSFYVSTCHAFGPCLQDCEALHTQMLANHRVSSSDAHAQDKRQGNLQAFANVAAKLAAERSDDGNG